MDRRVKERLVGATILVAVVVLVVPELLFGGKPPASAAPNQPPAGVSAEPMRTVTVDVSQNPATALEPQPQAVTSAPAANTAAAPPGAAELSAPSAAPSAVPAPQAKPAAPARPTLEAAPSPPMSTVAHRAAKPATLPPRRGAWAVQLGSFSDKGNAEKLRRTLQSRGYAVYISSNGKGRMLRYRVRIGPFADRNYALHWIAKLKAQGRRSSLVALTAPR